MMIRQSTQEVEDNDTEYACRGIANISCTRCTKDINTWYREEIGLLLLLEVVVIDVGKGDSGMKKEESVASKEHRRGTVQRMEMAHRA
jgi:hypothetical protein